MGNPDLEKTRIPLDRATSQQEPRQSRHPQQSQAVEQISLEQLNQVAQIFHQIGWSLDRFIKVAKQNPAWSRQVFEWMEAQQQYQQPQQQQYQAPPSHTDEVSRIRQTSQQAHRAAQSYGSPQITPSPQINDPRTLEITRIKAEIRNLGKFAGDPNYREKYRVMAQLTMHDIKELVQREIIFINDSHKRSSIGHIAYVASYEGEQLEMVVDDRGNLAIIDFNGAIAERFSKMP